MLKVCYRYCTINYIIHSLCSTHSSKNGLNSKQCTFTLKSYSVSTAHMNKNNRVLFVVFMVIGFMVLYEIIGNYILLPIFIPDPCYYHIHETTPMIELLFDFSPGNGFHPSPAKLGYLLFAFFGFSVSTIWIRMNKRNRSKDEIID